MPLWYVTSTRPVRHAQGPPRRSQGPPVAVIPLGHTRSIAGTSRAPLGGPGARGAASCLVGGPQQCVRSPGLPRCTWHAAPPHVESPGRTDRRTRTLSSTTFNLADPENELGRGREQVPRKCGLPGPPVRFLIGRSRDQETAVFPAAEGRRVTLGGTVGSAEDPREAAEGGRRAERTGVAWLAEQMRLSPGLWTRWHRRGSQTLTWSPTPRSCLPRNQRKPCQSTQRDGSWAGGEPTQRCRKTSRTPAGGPGKGSVPRRQHCFPRAGSAGCFRRGERACPRAWGSEAPGPVGRVSSAACVPRRHKGELVCSVGGSSLPLHTGE